MPDHALIFGVSKYPRLRDLQGPINDADDFEDWLLDPQGGALDPGNILRVSTDQPRFSGDPSRPHYVDFVGALQELVDRADANRDRGGTALGERMYIYFAGHGYAARAGDAGLLPATASRQRLTELAEARVFADEIASYGMFRQVLAVADCCREDLGRVTVAPFPITLERYGPHGLKWEVFAVPFGSAAREGVLDGVHRGYFTAGFVDALRHAPRGPTGLLATAVNNHVVNFISRARASTRASIEDPALQPPADFVVTTGPGNGPIEVELTFAVADPAHEVVVTSSGTAIERRTGTDAAWQVKLAPGLYLVDIPAQSVTQPIEVISYFGDRHHVG